MLTVLGLYFAGDEAVRAREALLAEGFPAEALDLLTSDDKDDVAKLAALSGFVPAPDVNIYLEGVRRGGTLLTASVDSADYSRAATVMARYDLVNIAEWAASAGGSSDSLRLSDAASNEFVLDVIEEDLDVGTEAIERGRVRVYTRVSEREVAEEVRLRDETITVRRRKVDRVVARRADLFVERSAELIEVDEVPLVSKVARVVEEVSLEKLVAQRLTTLRETLRRREVEVVPVGYVRAYDELEPAYRRFFAAGLAGQGDEYAAVAPAFHFGHSLAAHEPFRSSPWEAVEADARAAWEADHPGTWAAHQDAVRFAWETAGGGAAGPQLLGDGPQAYGELY